MTNRPIVHLFCNAHIDPVWKWGWEEGAREAISTFRTAANLLDEYPEFVFNHNESLLYEWVEEYDPDLFARIQHFVREGRWNISGGWYLQPDCNLPGGETLVRVITEGRRYFAEKFGVRPPVAYNFDTFGLQQSGFEIYVHCRPTDWQMETPGPVYRWQGVDGTQILTVRPNAGWYCTPGSGQAQIQARRGVDISRETGDDSLVTWGLGNHGGGATWADLNLFREIIAEYANTNVEVRHSTPEAFLDRIKDNFENFPVKAGELQRTLAGCYTSVAPVKRQMREGETLMASAERWAAMAWWRYGRKYPSEELREAWKKLMFNTFHDILCGSLLEDAIPGVDDMYGYAHDVARRIVVRSQNVLLPNVTPTDGTIPLYVFNPHGTRMQTYVGLNFLRDYRQQTPDNPFALFDDRDNEIACQASGGRSVVLETGEGSIEVDSRAGNMVEMGAWQPYIGFVADVPPFSVRRYEVRYQAPQATAGALTVSEDAAGITVENTWWRMRFDHTLAAPVELIEKSSGRSLLKAPLQLFAMHDTAHAWGGEDRKQFNEPVSAFDALTPAEVGIFTGMEGHEGPALRVLSQGTVSTKIECLVGWQHTRASLSFTLYADVPYIDVDLRLHMQARRKMIKLVLPFDLPDVRAICEVPYGTAERAADSTEWPYARWLRLESGEAAVGIANNGQNGFDVSPDGVLRLSISRGAVHVHWDERAVGLDTSKSYTWMDQGQIDTHFRILGGENVTAQLVPLALELNQPLERFFTYFPATIPANAPSHPAPFLSVEPATVIVGALKKAEHEDALVVRLVESVGQSTTARVIFEGDVARKIEFRPYEIKSFLIGKDGAWRACNLLEEEV
jgi:alpha-mannosidase